MSNNQNPIVYGDVEKMCTVPCSRPTFLLPQRGGIERLDGFLIVYSRKYQNYGEPFETFPVGERGFIHYDEPCRDGTAYCFHSPLSRKDPFYQEALQHSLEWVEFENEEDFINDCKSMGLEITD